MENKFYVCETCGKVMAVLKDSKVPTVCCGKPMKELVPGTSDASLEKHVPVCRIKGNIVDVTVGAAEHPMTPEHLIEWIALETNLGISFRMLAAEYPPKAEFVLCEDELPVSAYAYCNIHGLWKS